MPYRKAVIPSFGGPDVLEIREVEALPEPGPGQVRVKTLAAGVAFTDIMIRKGQYPDIKEDPPFTPGYDMVGAVDKLGPEVPGFQVGERVAALTVIGAQAEYLCLDADHLVPVPSGLDPAAAVSLVLSYTTAYQMLTRKADLQAGDRILVHGAGGAVGTALVQLGRYSGFEVYGTGSGAKQELITSLGASSINYQSEDFVSVIGELDPPGVDAVFDHLGGAHLKRSYAALRKGGELVAYGFYNATLGRGGSVVQDFARLALWNLLPNGKSASFYSIGSWRKSHPGWFVEDLEDLFGLCLNGEIRPEIWKTISLDQLPDAHRWIENAEAKGKIVVIFPEEK